ncbi:MAG: aminopeptidase P N-terminal domain-containing protein, partial [Candidatus Saccharicenans sp.]|nr:aminopeptidase P N-terminal domain-containing protein [Candidatus Saccharicenans sp.]
MEKRKSLWLLFLALAFCGQVLAQATNPAAYTPGEFEKRRQALMQAVGQGVIILFASPGQTGAGHFRQDNDFYYFTGLEDANAVLVMIPSTGDSFLFVPQKTEREKMMEGGNSLDDPGAREILKLRNIYPVSYLDEFLARLAGRQDQLLYLRLSPEDSVGESRSETALFLARRHRNPYNAQPNLNQFRAERFRQLYPAAQLKDVTPF